MRRMPKKRKGCENKNTEENKNRKWEKKRKGDEMENEKGSDRISPKCLSTEAFPYFK